MVDTERASFQVRGVTLDDELDEELRGLDARGRLRSCPAISPGVGPLVSLGETSLVSFCSNDYLGLSAHPEVIHAARAAAALGAGARASRLVCGDHDAVRRLEAALAELFAVPAALVFPTGYQANIGVITALAGPQDLILSDALNHASLIDGCRLSRARVAVYEHANAQSAARAARELMRQHVFRRVLVLTESVFSMDGDVAPLTALAATCTEIGAHLVVDEAHAAGVLGPNGRGVCAAAGIVPYATIGTLGKAYASGGGFVLGSRTLRSYLINRARTFIFTTGLAPPAAAAAEAALTLSASQEGDRLRRQLLERVAFLRNVPLHEGLTPIVPAIMGSDDAAVSASRALREAGFFVQAIRPPTVPEGTARLRLTLSAAHTLEQVRGVRTALGKIAGAAL